MFKASILKTDLMKIHEDGSQTVFYGCDQEWFPTEWQRISGCGPTAVATIIIYLSRTRDIFGMQADFGEKSKCLELMEDIWKYVTPIPGRGVNTTGMLYEGTTNYAKSKGLKIDYRFCDIPPNKKRRPKLAEVIEFIKSSLDADLPVAFLNLSNGGEENLKCWHWVTIISLEYEDNDGKASTKILDDGIIKIIDLALWYDTTTAGGGFVYFNAMDRPPKLSRRP
ncbi:MAG TPA: hypothetical protein PK467_20485 [Candidatus Wallbacteria bacterium]|nr:hypothetical protein [Candidatus Wallbacteria bacterium]